MIAKLKRKRASDVYIVGTFAWAMKQLADGKKMHRLEWPHGRSLMFGDKFKPTAVDKKALDWRVVVAAPPLPIDMPIGMPDDPFNEPEGASPWIGLLAIVLFVVLMIGAALYADGSYKLPF